jgi:hypothetical protein
MQCQANGAPLECFPGIFIQVKNLNISVINYRADEKNETQIPTPTLHKLVVGCYCALFKQIYMLNKSEHNIFGGAFDSNRTWCG